MKRHNKEFIAPYNNCQTDKKIRERFFMGTEYDRTFTILSNIKKYYREYEEITGEGGIPKRDEVLRYHSVSMILFTLMNLSFELGEEIISIKKLEIPRSYRDIFNVLSNAGLISEDLKGKMSSFVFYRNQLAHQYATFDEADLGIISENIDSLCDFVSLMAEIIAEDN
ncbi:DUF86 domain-containing protein [Methanoplanus limicola]|nr:HepT-like ribonuclease domain-containing protein [Methanoplanus limicola]